MPTCTGCSANFADTFQFCPYCGKEKPKPQDTLIPAQQKPAINACPVCLLNDRAEKASSIYARDTHHVSGTTTSTNTYVDREGHTHQETSDNPYNGTQQSNLAAYLAPPTQPEKKGACFRYLLVVPAIAGSCIGPVTIVNLFIPESREAVEPAGLLFITCVSLIMAIVSMWTLYWIFVITPKTNRTEAKRHEIEFARWQQAMSRWEQLYYCHRDSVVFIPGNAKHAPLNAKNSLLYDN